MKHTIRSLLVLLSPFTLLVAQDDPDLPTLTALRARISGGAMVFNGPAEVTAAQNGANYAVNVNSDQFGNASLYLAFESQPRFTHGACRDSRADACLKNMGTAAAPEYHYEKWYFDPLLNVRLTSIPVVALSDKIESPGADFLKSQKAAQIVLGATASYNFAQFQARGHDFHWGLGPVYRSMFQSVTNAQRALRLWNLDDDLYDAHTFGGRLSLYSQESAGTKSYWRPTAYLDFSWGRFQNFEKPTANTAAAKDCLANPGKCIFDKKASQLRDDFTIKTPGRVYIESRLYLNYIYIGFDLNNGSGRDDLRFIGGVTVGLDKFFKQ